MKLKPISEKMWRTAKKHGYTSIKTTDEGKKVRFMLIRGPEGTTLTPVNVIKPKRRREDKPFQCQECGVKHTLRSAENITCGYERCDCGGCDIDIAL